MKAWETNWCRMKACVSMFSSLRIAYETKTSLRHFVLAFKPYEDGVSYKAVELLEYEVTNKGGIRTTRAIGHVTTKMVHHYCTGLTSNLTQIITH